MRETERRPPLFRGQSNSNWHLDTTLERWVAPRRQDVPVMSFVDYYNIILSARAEIETLTGTIWTTSPQYRIITKEMDQMRLNYDVISQELAYGRIPGYEYIAYLRHHRFPSPLLDWTRSPYIAAYFAFSEAVNSEAVSIYMLSEGVSDLAPPERRRLFGLGQMLRFIGGMSFSKVNIQWLYSINQKKDISSSGIECSWGQQIVEKPRAGLRTKKIHYPVQRAR
jgi:hypothetical protein